MRAFLKVAIGRNLFDKSFFQMMVQQLNRIFSVKYMHKMTRSSISIIFRWCSDYDGMNVITLTLLLNGKPTSNHPYGSENQKKKKKKVYQIILNFLLHSSQPSCQMKPGKKIKEIIGILTIYLLRYIQLMQELYSCYRMFQ